MLFLYLGLVNSSNVDKVEFLFNNYHKFMLHIANDMLNNIKTAEDIVQMSFLKIIKNTDKIKIDVENVNQNKNFVRIVVTNTVRDYLRKQKKQLKEEFIGEKDDNYEIPDSLPLPLEQLTQDEGYERLLGYISELSDTYKDVCRLKFIHDCTEKEIAELLNLPVKTVNVRIFRARQILKVRIIEREYEKV